jgi:hypothetical protein
VLRGARRALRRWVWGNQAWPQARRTVGTVRSAAGELRYAAAAGVLALRAHLIAARATAAPSPCTHHTARP